MKILVTARDVGAAHNTIEIVKELRRNKDIDVHIYAQGAAIECFKNAPIKNYNEVNFPELKDKNSIDSHALLAYAKKLINTIQPDVVLTGITSPGTGGIDEAITAVCPQGIKSFVMQDFWGTLNLFFDDFADYCLCLDKHAEVMTKKHYDIKTIVIGSPYHSKYGQTDILKRREQLRGDLAHKPNDIIIGLFGQALHHLDGYKNTVYELIRSLASSKSEISFFYRKHPLELQDDVTTIDRFCKEFNLATLSVDDLSTEDALLICDMVSSCFSNCIYDACQLNRISNKPLLTPILLAYEDDILKFSEQYRIYDYAPYQHESLAYFCNTKDSFASNFEYLHSDAAKEHFWQQSKKAIVNPSNAARRAVEVITSIAKQTIAERSAHAI